MDLTVRLFSYDPRCRSPLEVYASSHSTSLDCQTTKGFQDNLPTPSPDLMVVKVFPLLKNRSYHSNTPSVERSLSVVKYHTSCGFILPLLLLSFVTWPSNPLALKNILRFEIGSIRTLFPLETLGPKTTYLAHPGSTLKPWALIPYCNIPEHQPHCRAMLLRETYTYIQYALNQINTFNMELLLPFMLK
jgi:hypothetical protein